VNEVLMLRDAQPRRVLQLVLDQRLPLAVSYFSEGTWRLARAVLVDVLGDSFTIRISPQKKNLPADIHEGLSIGFTFQYGFGREYERFVFDAVVKNVERSADSLCIGVITLALPEGIEVVQRRSYRRVRVPEKLNVDVNIWSRSIPPADSTGVSAEVTQSWNGKLLDISAGGLFVGVDLSQGSGLEVGHFVGLRFTPLHDETVLSFNAYIKNIAPDASGNNLCIGMEVVGLEASPEGRLVLQRLCNIVDQYSQMNLLSA
jgi:hypothetical protein